MFMSSNFRLLVTSCICLLLGLQTGLSQTNSAGKAGLIVHPIRNGSATDTSFADLEFLRQEIGSARIVFLGEPTHGEGNVFEAKARLVQFLQQRMGFTTLGMESGFYEMHKAQQ